MGGPGSFSVAQQQDKGQDALQTGTRVAPSELEEKLLFFEGVRAKELAAQRRWECPLVTLRTFLDSLVCNLL